MHFSTSVLSSIAAICATANGALTRVNDFGANPSNLQMNIYVPAKVAAKPAIILAVRAFTSLQGFFNKPRSNS
jgi:acetylxylan esterase